MQKKFVFLLATALVSAGGAHAQNAATPSAQAAQVAQSAQAAQSASAPGIDVTDIIVTARKRDESLQEVPLAISAFGSQEIKSARIERLSDLAKLTPGLNYTPLFGAQNQLPIIRGAAQTFGALNVGVFLDGVYLSGKAGVDLELNDLERIEVVKGPQSALYGRNTFAGAINYITQRPSDEWTGTGEVTVGDRGLVKIAGSVSGPVADIVRIRLGGFYREHNGFYRSGIDGGRVDFAESYGGIFTMEVEPSDNFIATIRASYSKEDVGQPASSVIRTNSFPGRPAGSPAGTSVNILYIGELPSIPRDGVLVNTLSNPVSGNYGQQGETFRGNLKLEWDLGGATITSLTSIDQRSTDFTFDGDNTICETVDGCRTFGFPFVRPFPQGQSSFNTSSSTGRSRDFAQELRIASPGGQTFDWLIGGFYYNNNSNFVDRSLSPITAAQSAIFGFPNQINTTKSLSGFGSVTFRPSEVFNITGELRYEKEDQTFRQAATNQRRDRPCATNPSFCVFNLEQSFDFVTPRVIVDWKPSDGKMLYASVARGVKTGGFNTNLNITAEQREYDPEFSWNYEVGAKTDWLDNRLRFNIAAYYTDWQDQQVACQNPASFGGSSTQRTYVCNVGQARIFGVETDFVARFGDIFTLTGNYAFTDAKYTRFVDDSLAANLIVAGLPPIDFDGNRLPYVPQHKVVLSPRINIPVSEAYEFEGRVDFVHQSKTYLRADNLQTFGAKTTVDIRAGFASDRYALQFFVNNLFDDDTPVAGVRFFDQVNFFVPAPLVQGADRRQIGVTLRAGF